MNITIQRPTVAFQRAVVSGIINAMSKDVILVYEDAPTICPVCLGTDPFCLTCNGNVYISTTHSLTVAGTVRWKTLEKKIYRPEGQYMEGDCTVTLLHTDDLEALMFRVSTVYVDNRKCVVDHWNVRGSPTNRIYLVLKEDLSVDGTRV